MYKRPPLAELEMYRVCFELLPKFLKEHSPLNEKVLHVEYDVEIPGETHPRRAEIFYPAPAVAEASSLPESLEATAALKASDIELTKALDTSRDPTIEKAFDDALKSVVEKAPDVVEKMRAAASLSPTTLPLLLGHDTLPLGATGTDWLPSDESSRASIAYFSRAASEWRKHPEAAKFLEVEAPAVLDSLPREVLKCGLPACFIAGAPKAFKRCGACRKVYYCSANCQRADWGEHKKVCRKVK